MRWPPFWRQAVARARRSVDGKSQRSLLEQRVFEVAVLHPHSRLLRDSQFDRTRGATALASAERERQGRNGLRGVACKWPRESRLPPQRHSSSCPVKSSRGLRFARGTPCRCETAPAATRPPLNRNCRSRRESLIGQGSAVKSSTTTSVWCGVRGVSRALKGASSAEAPSVAQASLSRSSPIVNLLARAAVAELFRSARRRRWRSRRRSAISRRLNPGSFVQSPSNLQIEEIAGSRICSVVFMRVVDRASPCASESCASRREAAPRERARSPYTDCRDEALRVAPWKTRDQPISRHRRDSERASRWRVVPSCRLQVAQTRPS